MKGFIARILAIGAVAIGLAACTTVDLFEEAETVEQTHFITIAVFNEYDKVGAEIFNNPNTPDAVKEALNKARPAAITALNAAHEAFNTVIEIRKRLREVEDQSLVDELVVSAAVLRERVDVAKAQVGAFKALIQSYNE